MAQRLGLWCTLLLAGCTDRAPTEPEPISGEQVAPPPPRRFVSPVVATLGTLALPAGSDDGDLSPGGEAPAPRSLVFQESGWVMLRASGAVRYEVIDGMYEYPCGFECIYPHPPFGGSGSVGPLGINGRLVLEPSVGNATHRGRLWTPVAVREGEAESLMKVSAGEVLWLGRTPLDGHKSCFSCEPQRLSAGWYKTSGSHEVEVQKVLPIQVEPDRRGSSVGETVTFRTELIEGMGQLQWYYVNPARGMASYVSACRHQETCTITVPHAGHMLVYGTWRDRSTVVAQSNSPTVGVCSSAPTPLLGAAGGPQASAAGTEDECAPEEDPGLVLECKGGVVQANGSVVQEENRVTRGETLRCNVAPRPSTGSLEQVRWQFTDAESHVIPGPTGPRRWGGPMVVGGAMRVDATVDGQPYSQSVDVAVLPRQWDSPVPPIVLKEGVLCFGLQRRCFTYAPETQRDLGTTLPHPDYMHLSPAAAHIGDGPNQGWSYLAGTENPVQFESINIYINLIFSPSAQGPQPARFWRKYPDCDRDAMRRFVIAHEMVHATLQQEHTSFFDAYVEKLTAFVPLPEWEEMLLAGGETMEAAATHLSFLAGYPEHKDIRFMTPGPCDLNLPP